MEYNYQLKMTPRGLTEENLFARRLQDSFYDVVFDRDGEGIFLCPALEDLDVSALTDQQPFLYFLSLSRKKQRLQPVFDFFQNMIFLSDSSVSLEMEDIFLRAKANREELLALLQTMTPSITDLRIHQKEISFVHTIQENLSPFPGTQKPPVFASSSFLLLPFCKPEKMAPCFSPTPRSCICTP